MGKLLILVGPSASGKTTLLEKLPIPKLLTTTTRKPRKGEIDGVHYRFMSVEEFDKKVESGEMPERTNYAGVKYGILASDIQKLVNQQENAVVVLDTVGVQFLKNYFAKIGRSEDVKSVFIGITPETMKKRLEERGSAKEEIEKRITQAIEKELTPEYRKICDAVIWNDGLFEVTLSTLKAQLIQWGFLEFVEKKTS
ncbi:MAG: guanylate kinase [Tepidibacillus sp.]